MKMSGAAKKDELVDEVLAGVLSVYVHNDHRGQVR